MKVRCYIDPATHEPHIYKNKVADSEVDEVLARPGEDLVGNDGARVAIGLQAPQAQYTLMKQNRFPPGWDEQRAKCVLSHYESQTEDEAVAEDEAARDDASATMMAAPTDLVPEVRELIPKRKERA